jgi:hypothetical protein
MTLPRARTVDEYVEWIKQAVFEVQELRACLEYDLEDPQRLPSYLEQLETSVNSIFDAMKNGNYQFSRHPLPFMDLIQRFGEEIPFSTLLKQINETHQQGLDISVEIEP